MDEFRGFIAAAQYGGPQTGVDDEIPLLKRVVEARMGLTRALGFDSVHLGFRVDGQFAVYDCAKAERLKFVRKRGEIWIDLGVPISVWRDRTRAEIRAYLCDCVEAALNLLIERLKRDKLCLECELLYADWQGAKTEYLALP